MANRTLTVAAIQTSLRRRHGGQHRQDGSASCARRPSAGAQVILPSELFQGIYFCDAQDPKWFATALSG